MKNEVSDELAKIMQHERILIYDISPEALKYYKNNARSGANAEDEVIRRKLTSLVMSVDRRKEIDNQKYICKFSGFNIVVNEKKKLIEWIYWDKEDHRGSPASEEENKKLMEAYGIFKLSNSGNSFKETSKSASHCNNQDKSLG